MQLGKLRKIGAEYGILGGFSFMIKVLFICHGRTPGLHAIRNIMGQKGAIHG